MYCTYKVDMSYWLVLFMYTVYLFCGDVWKAVNHMKLSMYF